MYWARRNKLSNKKDKLKKIESLIYINSCDFYDNYVIIDDNQIPYAIENFDNFTLYNDVYVDVIVVPLYKRIFLDAEMAQGLMEIFLNYFGSTIKRIFECMGYNNSESDPLVTRMFLTSSRKYKNIRIKNSKTEKEKMYYSNMLFPKFLWVVELSLYDIYKEDKEVLGEFVIDATRPFKGYFHPLTLLILVRICSFFGFRFPFENDLNIILNRFSYYNKSINSQFPMYINNLNKGEFINDEE